MEREAQQAPVAGAVKESNLLIKAEGQQEAAGISRDQREKSGLQPCVLVREKKKEKEKMQCRWTQGIHNSAVTTRAMTCELDTHELVFLVLLEAVPQYRAKGKALQTQEQSQSASAP